MINNKVNDYEKLVQDVISFEERFFGNNFDKTEIMEPNKLIPTLTRTKRTEMFIEEKKKLLDQISIR